MDTVRFPHVRKVRGVLLPILAATIFVISFPSLLAFSGVVGPIDKLMGHPKVGADLGLYVVGLYLITSLLSAAIAIGNGLKIRGKGSVVAISAVLVWLPIQAVLILASTMVTFGK